MVLKKGFLTPAAEVAALGLGGVRGREVLTPNTVNRKPSRAGMNQITLRRGI